MKLTFLHSTNSTGYLLIRYTDTALYQQAKWEQMEADDPARQVERMKLKQQL